MHNKFAITVCLICTLLLTSCASEPEPLSAETRQRLGKVYLSSAGATGETFFHADFDNGGTGGALKGAGKGAVQGLDDCVNGALGAGILAPVVLVVCAPIKMTANMVQGSSAGGAVVIPEETLANMEQQTNQVLKQADLSPALVATLDDVSQKHPALAQYEITHGILPPPENGDTLNDVAANWGYQTVMEIQVTKAGFDSDEGRVPMLHLSMTANVRLVEATTGSVIQQQDYHYNSSPQSVAAWFRDDYRNLFRELALANQAIAADIVKNTFTY